MKVSTDNLMRWDSRRNIIMMNIIMDRYKYDKIFADVLNETKDARLCHFSRGQSGDAYGLGTIMMNIRMRMRVI